MAQAGVIRDFMVALGFKTDNSGLEKMQGAMEGVELKATALKGALMALATGAVIAVRQTASELDKLYFSSQRIGASVSNINAYGNAVTQLGGSAEDAVGSLESLAEKMRNSPGYESQIKSLGVDTRDANGEMRDRVEMMKDLSGVLAKMPAYQANAYASSLGIDQNTLLAMRDGKFMANMGKYQKIQKELGMNDELAKSGNEFMTEYRDLTMMTKTGFQVIVMQAGKALIPVLRLLNQLIQAGIHAFSQLNPQIKEGLAVALRFGMLAIIFGAFFKTFGVLLKIIPLLKIFIGLLKMMRLAFLASPIGIILALASALALLYDDYKTWRDGGKSLFDWSKWTNGIDTIINKIKDFLKMLDEIKDKVINFVQKVISDPVEAVKEVAEIAADEAKNLAQKGADALNDKIAETDTGKKILDKVGEGTAKVSAFFGNEEAKKAVEINEGKPAATTPAAPSKAPPSKIEAINAAIQKGAQVLMGAAKVVQEGVHIAAQSSKKPYETAMTQFHGGTIKGFTPEQTLAFANRVMFRENKPGKTDTVNKWGYTGKYQFGASALAETGFIDKKKLKQASKGVRNGSNARAHKAFLADKSNWLIGDWEQYKNSHEMQDISFRKLTESNIKYGRSVHKGDVKRMMGFAMAAHLKGAGNAKKWYLSGINSKDGNGTRTSDYAEFGEGALKWVYPSDNTSNVIPKNSKDLANFAQNADLPAVNPHKSQVNNSNMQSRSIVIHQSYKTDMSINGTASPIETANTIKRQQENSMVFMARSAQGVLG